MEKTSKRAINYFSIIITLIYISLGIILIVNPKAAFDMVAIVIGAIFLVVGIIKVIDYFIMQGNYDFFNYELIHGLVSFVIGIIILAYARQVSTLFIVLLGIWITYRGLINMNLSMKLHASKIKIWITVFILALVMMLSGIYIIIAPENMIVLVGAFMIGYAIIEFIENFIFMKNVDKI